MEEQEGSVGVWVWVEEESGIQFTGRKQEVASRLLPLIVSLLEAHKPLMLYIVALIFI